MRSDLPIPNTAGHSIEKEVPQSMALPLCSIRRRGITQDMRWRGGFSRILEFSIQPVYILESPSLLHILSNVHPSEIIALSLLLKPIKVMVCFLLPFP